jgi:molybdenum cofactor cytidylyltransferase
LPITKPTARAKNDYRLTAVWTIEMVSAVVLSAGKPDSMGEQKLLLPLRDKPVLQWVLEGALASAVTEIICVVRDLRSARRHITLVNERLIWLVNGGGNQSSFIIAGLWAVDPKSDGVLFLVGDQPFIRSELIDALLDRFENSHASIVAPTFKGQTRNPILFRRELFPELLKLTGDRSGHALLEKHRDRAELVPCEDEIPFVNIDVRAGYAQLKEPA